MMPQIRFRVKHQQEQVCHSLTEPVESAGLVTVMKDDNATNLLVI